MSNTHEWVAPGISKQMHNSKEQVVDSLPWWAALIRTRDYVRIPDVENLPPAAEAEKELFRSQQIKSLICVPIFKKDSYYGFFGLDAVNEQKQWNDEDIIILKVVAEIIANALIRHQSDEKIRYLSMHDQLTGLYNRHYFVNELIRLQNSRDYPITIISAELDGLKLINDSLGHHAGDRYLQAGAEILRITLRSYDRMARVGGDEFALILPQTDQRAAELLVKRIRHQVEQYNSKAAALPVSLSIGLAVSHDSTVSLEEIYKLADGLMYEDKLERSKKAKEDIVNAMLSSLVGRDDYSPGDAKLIQDLSFKLGEKAGLSKKELARLQLLAQVYNIGLAALPAGSLGKQAPPDSLQNTLIQQHVEKGYRIAISSPWLSDVAEVILHQEECWDGSGYPLGLQGEAIPVECRILAVAKAYSSLIATNASEVSKQKDHISAELHKLSGRALEPLQVERLFEIIA